MDCDDSASEPRPRVREVLHGPAADRGFLAEVKRSFEFISYLFSDFSVKLCTVVVSRAGGACPEFMGVCSVMEKGSPEWGACPEWVRGGREARLYGGGGYARVEVSLDVCRLHRFGVQSNSSAQSNNFNTSLVLFTNHH